MTRYCMFCEPETRLAHIRVRSALIPGRKIELCVDHAAEYGVDGEEIDPMTGGTPRYAWRITRWSDGVSFWDTRPDYPKEYADSCTIEHCQPAIWPEG